MKKNNYQAHATMLAVVGGYMLYIAWHLFENMTSDAPDMAPGIAVALIIAFVLAGGGVLVYAWKTLQSGRKDDGGNDDDERLPKS